MVCTCSSSQEDWQVNGISLNEVSLLEAEAERNEPASLINFLIHQTGHQPKRRQELACSTHFGILGLSAKRAINIAEKTEPRLHECACHE